MTLRFSTVPGGVIAEIDGQELAVLRAVPGFLSSIATDAADPLEMLRQQRPAVYADDDDADHEYRRLVVGDLTDAQADDRATLERVLNRIADGPVTLSFEEAEGVLRAVAATRLALAVRNGMFEFDELPEVRETPQQMLVAFLGLLQDELVGAIGDISRIDQ